MSRAVIDLARFDAAIVDLDGTMVDTVGDFDVALNRMLADLGLQGSDGKNGGDECCTHEDAIHFWCSLQKGAVTIVELVTGCQLNRLPLHDR